MQRSLFPDAYEIEADALDALEGLELERGLACVREARRRDPGLENLDEIEAAIAWLARELRGDTDPAALASAFLALPRAGLGRGAADFADRALARFATRDAGEGFLDAEERVPVGALRLVLGRTTQARAELAKLVAGREDRADLWGWLGDASALVERPEEAAAAYVRALVLDAARADLFRIRSATLRSLLADLRAVHADEEARELLFTEAWLQGALDVPAGNGWLDAQVARLRAATRATADAPRPARLRRWSLLLYLDRSRARSACDLAEREEMQSLEPELFRRFMAVLAEREGRA